MKQMQKFEFLINQLALRHGVHAVFSDFLTLLICAFSHGAKEEEYLRVINRYEKPDAYKFSEALGPLVIEMTGPHGDGMVDVLGKYFEENLSYGKNGQFFTPQAICDMMARMNNPVKPSDRILDPACGSGRMLMAMAKVNRFARFYGADVDANCAKMAVINLCLNTMYGEVVWMNSLTNQFFGGWQIVPTVKGVPRIIEINEKQSYIHLKLPEEIQKTKTVIPDIEIPVLDFESKPKQQLLFEF